MEHFLKVHFKPAYFPYYFLQLFNETERSLAIASFITSDSSALLSFSLRLPQELIFMRALHFAKRIVYPVMLVNRIGEE